MTAVGGYQEGTPMTDSPLSAGTRLRDAIAAAVTEAPLGSSLTDALLPLVVAEVRSAAGAAWDEGYHHVDAFGHREDNAQNPYRVEEAPPAEWCPTHDAMIPGPCTCPKPCDPFDGKPLAARVDEPATPPAAEERWYCEMCQSSVFVVCLDRNAWDGVDPDEGPESSAGEGSSS